MKKLAAKVLCGLFAITATAGFSMVLRQPMETRSILQRLLRRLSL